MAMPVTRYAKSGDVHIAYQVFGGGPIDLVFVPGFVSHIENYWDHPDLARWLLRLSSFARVAIFDKRGTGLSDRVAEAPSLDQRMDDARAVMDAAGMERAALLGVSEGGPLATPVCRNLSATMPGAGALRHLCTFLLDYPRGPAGFPRIYR
jgi:pimeloyl-ACP methyl ester carboxylesterase